MTRLLIHVEGETEEAFVNEVLGPHLYSCGYTSEHSPHWTLASIKSVRSALTFDTGWRV